MITNPQLPPKSGYIEVVDMSGNHLYQKTQEQINKELEQEKLLAEQQKVNDITTQLESTQAMLDSILMGDITL